MDTFHHPRRGSRGPRTDRARRRWLGVAAVASGLAVLGPGLPAEAQKKEVPYIRNNALVPNANGESSTFSPMGDIRFSNPFFLQRGSNGRTCATCHVPETGWSLTPENLNSRFRATNGRDPVFRVVDGSVSPSADVSSVAGRREAYKLLLSRGLIRIGLPMPAAAEFTLRAVDDPYGHASEAELSLFRRPLPTANLKFLSTVMWDGRERPDDVSVHEALLGQANTATMNHAEAGRPLNDADREAIVRLATSLFTTQQNVDGAGQVHDGPKHLFMQRFAPGINTAPFNPDVFTLFTTWGRPVFAGTVRGAIARGEDTFNRREFGSGLTCSTCHNAPNAGSNSMGAFFNTGVSAGSRRTPDMPLYRLRCRATRTVTATTDPGRALITGRCEDIGRFKVPTLRGLSTRAPYFHDGSAATLADVLAHYEARFSLGLSEVEREELLLFLGAL